LRLQYRVVASFNLALLFLLRTFFPAHLLRGTEVEDNCAVLISKHLGPGKRK